MSFWTVTRSAATLGATLGPPYLGTTLATAHIVGCKPLQASIIPKILAHFLPVHLFTNCQRLPHPLPLVYSRQYIACHGYDIAQCMAEHAVFSDADPIAVKTAVEVVPYPHNLFRPATDYLLPESSLVHTIKFLCYIFKMLENSYHTTSSKLEHLGVDHVVLAILCYLALTTVTIILTLKLRPYQPQHPYSDDESDFDASSEHEQDELESPVTFELLQAQIDDAARNLDAIQRQLTSTSEALEQEKAARLSAESEITTIGHQLEQEKQSCVDSEGKIQAVILQRDQALTNKRKAKDDLARLEADCSAKDHEIGTLNSQLEQLKHNLESSKQLLPSSKDDAKLKADQVERLQKTFNASNKRAEAEQMAQMQAVQAENADFKAQLKHSQRSNTGLETAIADLTAQLEHVKSSNAGLETEMGKMRVQLEHSKGSNAELEAKIDEFKANSQQLEGTIGHLQDTAKQHKCPPIEPQWPKLTELKTANGQLERDIELLKAENTALKQELQALRSPVDLRDSQSNAQEKPITPEPSGKVPAKDDKPFESKIPTGPRDPGRPPKAPKQWGPPPTNNNLKAAQQGNAPPGYYSQFPPHAPRTSGEAVEAPGRATPRQGPNQGPRARGGQFGAPDASRQGQDRAAESLRRMQEGWARGAKANADAEEEAAKDKA